MTWGICSGRTSSSKGICKITTKGVVRFGARGKLSPRYIGPYEIVERMAYQLALPNSLEKVHDVFHVSHLKR